MSLSRFAVIRKRKWVFFSKDVFKKLTAFENTLEIFARPKVLLNESLKIC